MFPSHNLLKIVGNRRNPVSNLLFLSLSETRIVNDVAYVVADLK